MPAETRPTDIVTPENFFLGLPIVEFAPRVSGVLQPYINLGVVDNAELGKELETLTMEDGSSGTRTTVLELISKIDPEFTVGVFNFAPAVLRYALGAETLTPVVADAASAITNERVQTTTDPEDFLNLVNEGLNSGSITVTCGLVTDEAVGTGDGTTGDASGDFSLDFKVKLVADISGTIDVTSGGSTTNYTPIAVGAAASGNEVEVVIGTGAESGDLQFHVGGTPANVTGDIVATYTPSFTLDEGLPGGSSDAVDDARSDDGTVFTDETADANNATTGDVVLTPAVPVVADAFYVGMETQFDRLVFNIDTAGTGGTIAWEYSQGGASWASLTNVTDDTTGFLVAGTNSVTFDIPSDWRQDTVDSTGPYFYVRARVATAGSVGATGTQIWTSKSDDYLIDLKAGDIQVHHDASKSVGIHRPVIAGQYVEVDYTFNELAHTEYQPFTQSTFDGAIRLRHIPDQGGNIVWTAPSGQIQVTDDALTWDDENFMIATVVLKVLDAGGSDRFGTIKHYGKTQAGN